MPSLTLAEARARAAQLSEVSYDLEIDLTDTTTFASRSVVRFASSAPETFLELHHGQDVMVTVNGTVVAAAYDGARIALDGLLTGTGERNEVVVEARLPYVTDGDGMHTFTDPADGERYVSAYVGIDITQRVFACFDQVDLKAPIALRVVADPSWTVVSNGRLVAAQGGAWEFAPTPPIPIDLFVLCAGPWHSRTFEHAGIPMGWHARASLAGELDRELDELRTITEQCFDHYAGLFDEPFPFDTYDQVFVPGLNWGAMENPGCVTYRDELLPRGRTTEVERRDRAMVIAHEMSHMWFGDLVTQTWWEDIWLNESFAEYMGFRVSEEAAGFAGSWVGFQVSHKPRALVADRRRSTHPVAPLPEDVPDVDTASTNFDAISYVKGASALRQLVTWTGDDDFLSGVNAHLTRHRWGNAQLADLIAALDDASPRDVRHWAELWLRRSGHDTIRVERDGDVPVLVRDGVRPHRFLVTAYDDTLVEVGRELVDLHDEPVRLQDWSGRVVVPNAHGETFARLQLDERSWAAVEKHLGAVRDDLARSVLWATAIDAVATRDVSPERYLTLVDRHLPAERHVSLVTAVVEETLAAVVPRRVPATRAVAAHALVAAACRAGLRSGGDPVAFTGGLARTGRDAEELRRWLAAGRTDHGVPLDPQLRWRVVQRLAALGELDATAIEDERRRDGTSTGDLGAAAARAARPVAAAKEAAWAALTEEDISNRLFSAVASGLWQAEQAELVAAYLPRYLDAGPRWAARGPAFSAVVGQAFPSFHLDDAQLGLLRDALAGDVPTVLRRAWEDALDDRT
ncbi:aminopeptidase N [Nocardioides halotolerans]|uniref:aminopeptidase N n=1 Tax=Nocardioides halotolerans TaxID=433660 RepID=UPI00041DAC47|nr:aminopeptidase N [Nocardioides halotolerans]